MAYENRRFFFKSRKHFLAFGFILPPDTDIPFPGKKQTTVGNMGQFYDCSQTTNGSIAPQRSDHFVAITLRSLEEYGRNSAQCMQKIIYATGTSGMDNTCNGGIQEYRQAFRIYFQDVAGCCSRILWNLLLMARKCLFPVSGNNPYVVGIIPINCISDQPTQGKEKRDINEYGRRGTEKDRRQNLEVF